MARPPEPERKSRTLAKAADYVLANGLSGLSLRPLAAALGTSTRMLLYDFDSKERLVAEVLAEIRRRESELLAEHAPAVESRAELLHGIWLWISDPERAPFLRLFFEVYVDAMTHPDTYSDEGRAMVTDWLGSFAGISSDADDPIAATLFIAVVRGLLLDRLTTHDDNRTNEAFSRFVAMINPSGRASEL